MPDAPQLAGARAVVVNWRDLDHSLAGGSERYAWEFSRALVGAGATVEFLTARDHGQASTDVRDGIVIRRGGGAITFYPWAWWQLVRRRRRLDVVIDPECGIPVFSPLIVRPRTAVVLLVHHVHMDQFATYFRPPMSWLGQWLEGWLMPRVYSSVPTYAVSESTAAEMRKRLSWRGEIGILENGSTRDGGVEREGPGDPRRVAVLGRLVPHKRVDAVVRAVAALESQIPGLRLEIIGRGPEADALRGLVVSLGVQDSVTVHGYLPQEELNSLLGACGLHVCASDVEGWGQVVIEAAGHGIPTIGRDVPGLRDSIVAGDTGWLIGSEGNKQLSVSLSEQILRSVQVLSDPSEQTRFEDSCRAWARRFTWERMHEEAVRATVSALPLPVSSTGT